MPWGHPSHLLKFSFGALSSREAPSKIQEAHVVASPSAHLKHTMAVGDGLPVALGCLAVGTHMEADRGHWCGRHTGGNSSQYEDRYTEENPSRGCKQCQPVTRQHWPTQLS